MLGLGRKKKENEASCFFCPQPASDWKLEVKTAEGVLVKHVCVDCKEYLERMAKGESLYNMYREFEEAEESAEDE